MSDEEPQGTPISVFDKENPSLGATKEAQDVASLDKIVVPPGAYTDPGNPAAAAGSVNMSVYTHPADLTEEYGDSVEPGEDDVRSTIDTHAEEQAAMVEGGGAATVSARSEDRDEWTKADWVSQAGDYGLAKSGNMDTVKERVEDYEAQVEEAKQFTAGDWQNQIADATDGEELASLRQLYDASGASFSTVDQAFDNKQTALSAE